jgi:murein DD-endopeptidase MepM/ murein hydrolase activator NlpD
MTRLLGLEQVPVFCVPGDAKITTEFGPNIPDYPTPGKSADHWGLDMVLCTDGSNSKTCNICAIAAGTVIAQRKWVKVYDEKGKKIYSPSEGNCVYILHDDKKTITRYYNFAYGSVPDKIVDGARVEAGELLGKMGNTGYSFGAHLHFQVELLDEVTTVIDKTLKGTPVDPEPYLLGEKIIGKEDEYFVVLGIFDTEKEARKYQEALKILGTDSYIEKK